MTVCIVAIKQDHVKMSMRGLVSRAVVGYLGKPLGRLWIQSRIE